MPTIDELKRQRDGHLSAGKYKLGGGPGLEPVCEECGEGYTPERGRVFPSGSRRVYDDELGRHTLETTYTHRRCSEERRERVEREAQARKRKGTR